MMNMIDAAMTAGSGYLLYENEKPAGGFFAMKWAMLCLICISEKI